MSASGTLPQLSLPPSGVREDLDRPRAVEVKRRPVREASRKLVGSSQDTVLFTAALFGLILWLVLRLLAA